jgi:hypothetical protein
MGRSQGGSRVDFSILPLPPIYYTSQATQLEASTGNSSEAASQTHTQTTTFIEEQLKSLSSATPSSTTTGNTTVAPIAARLLVATGSTSSSVVVSSQQAPPASQYDEPDNNTVFAGLSAGVIGAVAGLCVGSVLIGAGIGVMLYRRGAAHKQVTVKGSMHFNQEEHAEEMLPATDVHVGTV